MSDPKLTKAMESFEAAFRAAAEARDKLSALARESAERLDAIQSEYFARESARESRGGALARRERALEERERKLEERERAFEKIGGEGNKVPAGSVSVVDLAQEIGRDKSSVFRRLKRHGIPLVYGYDGAYVPKVALKAARALWRA